MIVDRSRTEARWPRLKRQYADGIRYGVWIPSAVSLLLVPVLVISGAVPSQNQGWVLAASSAAAVGLPVAIALCVDRYSGTPAWVRVIRAFGWCGYAYHRLVALILGRFLNGWVVILFVGAGLATAVYLAGTLWGMVPDLQEIVRISARMLGRFGHWVILPLTVLACAFALTVLLWWMVAGLVLAPLLFVVALIGAIGTRMGFFDVTDMTLEQSLFVLLLAAVFLFWVPACVSWTVQQFQETAPGELTLPRVSWGGKPPASRSTWILAIMTGTTLMWRCLTAVPVGPLHPVEGSAKSVRRRGLRKGRAVVLFDATVSNVR